MLPSSQKYEFGIRDPRCGIRKNLSLAPDPGANLCHSLCLAPDVEVGMDEHHDGPVYVKKQDPDSDLVQAKRQDPDPGDRTRIRFTFRGECGSGPC
jgi:hypothetical protein